MKVISLWQPWASLIASGAKRIETRSWAPYPSRLRPGDEVAIHAAKRWTDEERELCVEDPFFKRYLQLAERRGLWDFEHPPLGCVVAVATFAGVRPTLDILREHHTRPAAGQRLAIPRHEIAFGNYAPGRWGWLLEDVRPIHPAPLRGQQGIFEWSGPPQPFSELPSAVCVTRVVNVKLEPCDVYIGRTMPGGRWINRGWGNPFSRKTTDTPVAEYRAWIATQPQLLGRIGELHGKRLGCWCAPSGGLPGNINGHVCHGEILAALADGL